LSPDESVTLDATVRDMQEIGKGCAHLETTQGRFEPVDLPAEFLVDGLQVRVRLRAAPPDMISICMLGQLVHVESVDRR
jgi:hypothetical protein